MFLRLYSLCLYLGLLVNLSSQTCFKPGSQDLLEVQYHENKRGSRILSIQIDSLDIKMKNNLKFSELVSDDCFTPGISTLQYKLDDDSKWESVDLDENSVEIEGTDPCKEYQVKIKINDDEQTWTFGNYKTNRASIINHQKPRKMHNSDDYFDNNFNPKFSTVDDHSLKVSWEDFCIPTTVNIFDENDEELCSEMESECIITSDPCKHYVFYFDVVESDVLNTHSIKTSFPFTTPPSDSELNLYFSYTSVTGTNLQWDLSHVFSELGDCIAELDYTLNSEDGTEVAQNVVRKDTADKQIDVPIQNDCGTTFQLDVTYKVQGFEGSLEKSIPRKVNRTSAEEPTSLQVIGSEIVVKKDVCLPGSDLTMKMERSGGEQEDLTLNFDDKQTSITSIPDTVMPCYAYQITVTETGVVTETLVENLENPKWKNWTGPAVTTNIVGNKTYIKITDQVTESCISQYEIECKTANGSSYSETLEKEQEVVIEDHLEKCQARILHKIAGVSEAEDIEKKTELSDTTFELNTNKIVVSSDIVTTTSATPTTTTTTTTTEAPTTEAPTKVTSKTTRMSEEEETNQQIEGPKSPTNDDDKASVNSSTIPIVAIVVVIIIIALGCGFYVYRKKKVTQTANGRIKEVVVESAEKDPLQTIDIKSDEV